MAFATAFVAILLDTQRSHLPWWAFSVAVPLHWIVLVGIVDAFLSRHGDRIPRMWLAPVVAVGSMINFSFTFIANDAAVRVPNASFVCVILLTMGIVRLIAYRVRFLDRAIASVIAANLACYIIRTMLWFSWDQQGEYAQGSAFSDYMTMFYFTSGIAMFAIALLMMLAIINDIVERNKIDAHVDSLTGALNRRGLENALGDATRAGATFGAAIAIDLDHFKIINDRFGHSGGDQVLANVGALLRNHCEHFGPLARMGGEEFLVLVKQSHIAAVETLAETLRVAIGAMRLQGLPADFQITASLGLALVGQHEAIDDMCRNADVALYVAKGTGRNRVVTHHESQKGIPFEADQNR